VVVCLERGADLHMAQLMPLPLTVSCFSKIQIGLPFLVPAHLGSPGKRAVKRVCVCVCVSYSNSGSVMVPHDVFSCFLLLGISVQLTSKKWFSRTVVPRRPTRNQYLQSFQNAQQELLTQKPLHLSSVNTLCELHWLPVHWHIKSCVSCFQGYAY